MLSHFVLNQLSGISVGKSIYKDEKTAFLKRVDGFNNKFRHYFKFKQHNVYICTCE